MKKYILKMKPVYAVLAALLTISTASCDSSLSFNAIRSDSNKVPAISANLSSLATGGSILRIPNEATIPEEIRSSNDIEVAFDNSKALIPVTKNSDGSLSFPLSNTVKIDSQGKFNVIFVIDNQKSYLVTMMTGPVLKLNSPGIISNPASGTIIKGEKLKLTANAPADSKDKFNFNWYYGSSQSGPFLAISGTSDTVEWTPNSVGNYFVKLEMIEKATGISSTYISPISLVFVTDANNIFSVSPGSTLLRGKQSSITANIPNVDPAKYDFTWAYSQSAQGPFLSITGNGKTINWTPNSSGSFFIKVDALNKETNQNSSFTSTEAVVFVTETDNIIKTEPALGNIIRGNLVKLDANVPITGENLTYSWAYSTTANGPWQSITGTSKVVSWNPPAAGSFFVKVDVVDKQSNNISTFTTPKAIVFVSEADNIIKTEPALGNIIRGNSIKIDASVPITGENLTYGWAYSTTANGPWQSIPGVAKLVEWNPPAAGSFFVKVDVVDKQSNNISTFTTSKAIVFVTEASNIFRTEPVVANIKRGKYVNVIADIPGAEGKNYQYNWSFSSSLTAPFSPITNATGDLRSNTVKWRPATEGSFYVKVDAVNIENQSVVSFTSTNPVVFVNEITPLFTTSPSPAKITQDASVDIMVDLETNTNSTFAWSYGVTNNPITGTWTSIGGTNNSTITWSKKVKVPGTYFIKVDISDPSDNTIQSFVSRSPIVFVDKNETSTSAATFGGP